MTIKKGLVTKVQVKGICDVDEMSVAEAEKIIEVEQFLEKLLGLRVHIEEIQ